jgi:hypothetical protein
VQVVMILDHSGPDLACCNTRPAQAVEALGVLVVDLVLPSTVPAWLLALAWLVGMAALAVLVGWSISMARLRLPRTPQHWWAPVCWPC